MVWLGAVSPLEQGGCGVPGPMMGGAMHRGFHSRSSVCRGSGHCQKDSRSGGQGRPNHPLQPPGPGSQRVRSLVDGTYVESSGTKKRTQRDGGHRQNEVNNQNTNL